MGLPPSMRLHHIIMCPKRVFLSSHQHGVTEAVMLFSNGKQNYSTFTTIITSAILNKRQSQKLKHLKPSIIARRKYTTWKLERKHLPLWYSTTGGRLKWQQQQRNSRVTNRRQFSTGKHQPARTLLKRLLFQWDAWRSQLRKSLFKYNRTKIRSEQLFRSGGSINFENIIQHWRWCLRPNKLSVYIYNWNTTPPCARCYPFASFTYMFSIEKNPSLFINVGKTNRLYVISREGTIYQKLL